METIGLWEVTSLIPHRYPFLFVDQIEIDISSGTKKGLKVRAILPPETMDFWMVCPLPNGQLGFPPNFAIEFWAQMIGAAFLHCNPECRNQSCCLGSMEKIKFEHPIMRGDVIEGEVVITHSLSDVFKAHGIIYNGDRVMATGDFTCGLLK